MNTTLRQRNRRKRKLRRLKNRILRSPNRNSIPRTSSFRDVVTSNDLSKMNSAFDSLKATGNSSLIAGQVLGLQSSFAADIYSYKITPAIQTIKNTAFGEAGQAIAAGIETRENFVEQKRQAGQEIGGTIGFGANALLDTVQAAGMFVPGAGWAAVAAIEVAQLALPSILGYLGGELGKLFAASKSKEYQINKTAEKLLKPKTVENFYTSALPFLVNQSFFQNVKDVYKMDENIGDLKKTNAVYNFISSPSKGNLYGIQRTFDLNRITQTANRLNGKTPSNFNLMKTTEKVLKISDFLGVSQSKVEDIFITTAKLVEVKDNPDKLDKAFEELFLAASGGGKVNEYTSSVVQGLVELAVDRQEKTLSKNTVQAVKNTNKYSRDLFGANNLALTNLQFSIEDSVVNQAYTNVNGSYARDTLKNMGMNTFYQDSTKPFLQSLAQEYISQKGLNKNDLVLNSDGEKSLSGGNVEDLVGFMSNMGLRGTADERQGLSAAIVFELTGEKVAQEPVEKQKTLSQQINENVPKLSNSLEKIWVTQTRMQNASVEMNLKYFDLVKTLHDKSVDFIGKYGSQQQVKNAIQSLMKELFGVSSSSSVGGVVGDAASVLGIQLTNNSNPYGLDDEFLQGVYALEDKYGIERGNLLRVMSFETGGTFSASTPNSAGSGAVGLIQLMPQTLRSMGYTTSQVVSMTRVQQLQVVDRFFATNPVGTRGIRENGGSFRNVYLAVFTPSLINKPDSHIAYREGSVAYTQNRGLDINNDGSITVGEIVSKANANERAYYESWERNSSRQQNSGINSLTLSAVGYRTNNPMENWNTVTLEVGVPYSASIAAQVGHREHWGRDYRIGVAGANAKDYIYSPFSGKVILARMVTGYGNLVIVRLRGKNVHAYFAHLNEISVRVGQEIEYGTLIGKEGTTGNVTGAHLHLEFRIVDPKKADLPFSGKYLAGKAVLDPKTFDNIFNSSTKEAKVRSTKIIVKLPNGQTKRLFDIITKR